MLTIIMILLAILLNGVIILLIIELWLRQKLKNYNKEQKKKKDE